MKPAPSDMDMPLDDIRAWIAGTLPAEDAARVERLLAEHPEWRRFADDLGSIYEFSGGEPPPVCTTDFADVQRRLGSPPRRLLPWVAAAAAVLLTGSVVHFAMRPPGSARAQRDDTFALTAIPLRAPGPDVGKPLAVPVALRDYHPIDDGDIRWLDDWQEAVEFSELSGRPILLFGTLPECPWCHDLRINTFSDERIVAMSEAFVPVEIDLASTPAELAEPWMAQGYPVLQIIEPDDRALLNFSGTPDSLTMARNLEEGLRQRGTTAPAPDWDRVGELATLALDADAAERAGRLGQAWSYYERLSGPRSGPGFERVYVQGTARLGLTARRWLQHARELYGEEPVRARGVLEAAAQAFSPSAVATDFETLLTHLDGHATFPRLIEAR